MNATIATANGKPEAKPVNRGFPGLRCPCCGETDSLSVDLDNLYIRCRENECEVSMDEVRELIAQWQRVLAWLEMAPALPE